MRALYGTGIVCDGGGVRELGTQGINFRVRRETREGELDAALATLG